MSDTCMYKVFSLFQSLKKRKVAVICEEWTLTTDKLHPGCSPLKSVI